MKLEDIGFYTLSDRRALNSTSKTPLMRGELLVTDKCNFHCPYCRGVKPKYQGILPTEEALSTLSQWFSWGLRNVRFSGGEPMTHPDLPLLVQVCKKSKVQRIAISTNGSFPLQDYKRLLSAGVNDFSISLDACCASTGETMMGVKGKFDTVVNNIKELSKLTYVTVGIVWNEKNAHEVIDTVLFAHSLGVADIRVISAAQAGRHGNAALDLVPSSVLEKHPILNYRAKRWGNPMRGITKDDSNICKLVLDDVAVVKNWHFPCIIYLREGGKPIGKVGPQMRKEREAWYITHNTYRDPICRWNCLDVCVAYNNRGTGVN